MCCRRCGVAGSELVPLCCQAGLILKESIEYQLNSQNKRFRHFFVENQATELNFSTLLKCRTKLPILFQEFFVKESFTDFNYYRSNSDQKWQRYDQIAISVQLAKLILKDQLVASSVSSKIILVELTNFVLFVI